MVSQALELMKNEPFVALEAFSRITRAAQLEYVLRRLSITPLPSQTCASGHTMETGTPARNVPRKGFLILFDSLPLLACKVLCLSTHPTRRVIFVNFV